MKVTLKDIAKAAGVYPTAVSAVLNNKSYTRISQERRDHIRRVAEELGYRPDFQASCLRRGKKATVGVFLPEWRDVLLLELITGLSAGSNRSGIPLTYNFGMTKNSYFKFIESMATYRHSAIISYVPFWDDGYRDILKRLEQYIGDGGKVISLNTLNWPMIRSITLDIDEATGGRLAAEYLLKQNCASLATLSLATVNSQIRSNAFQESTANSDLPLKMLAIPTDSLHIRKFIPAIDRIIDECPRPVGIFCVNGQDISSYIIARCLERGLKYRKDLHLISYDHGPRTGDYFDIPRIIQPFRELGELAMDKLENLLAEKEANSEILKPTLQFHTGDEE